MHNISFFSFLSLFVLASGLGSRDSTDTPFSKMKFNFKIGPILFFQK